MCLLCVYYVSIMMSQIFLLYHKFLCNLLYTSISILNHLCMLFSGIQLIPPYPTLPYPTLPYPTLPYPTLPFPTLPYPTLPYPTLPYPTLPFPTLPYPTLPYPTLPYPMLSSAPLRSSPFCSFLFFSVLFYSILSDISYINVYHTDHHNTRPPMITSVRLL